MTLQASRCIDYMRHTLGGPFSGTIDPVELVNQAGRYMLDMHRWKWLERPQADLDIRGDVSTTTATWVEATKTLTSTGSFANYTFLDGDMYRADSGTNVTEQLYKVESRTSDDAIVLKTSLASTGADLATGDITGTLEADSVVLPSDLTEIVGYDATQSLINSLEIVTLQRLLMLKTNQIQVTSYNFYGAIVFPEYNTSSTGPTPPVPILKLWPSLTANDARELTIFYRAGWIEVSEDSDYVQLPLWLEALFIEVCKAWARGTEEEDTASLSERLFAIQNSPLYLTAIRRDGMVQPDFGPLRGGAVETEPKGVNRFARSTVSGPS